MFVENSSKAFQNGAEHYHSPHGRREIITTLREKMSKSRISIIWLAPPPFFSCERKSRALCEQMGLASRVFGVGGAAGCLRQSIFTIRNHRA